MSDTIETEIDAIGVMTLKMNRPKVLNSLNSELVGDMIAALTDAATNDEVRAIVLTRQWPWLLRRGRPLRKATVAASERRGRVAPGDHVPANAMEIGFNPLVRRRRRQPEAGGHRDWRRCGRWWRRPRAVRRFGAGGRKRQIPPRFRASSWALSRMSGHSWLVPNMIGRARPRQWTWRYAGRWPECRTNGPGMGHGDGKMPCRMRRNWWPKRKNMPSRHGAELRSPASRRRCGRMTKRMLQSHATTSLEFEKKSSAITANQPVLPLRA